MSSRGPHGASKAIAQHHRVGVAHLAQPGGAHPCAHPVIVNQHDAGTAYPDPGVGGLHQLPAGGGDRVGAAASGELDRVADIEDVGGAGRIGLISGKGCCVDFPHLAARGKGLRTLAGEIE